MQMHITIQGLEEAKAKLGELGYVVDDVVDDIIEQAAEPMRQAVADKAPVGATGKLSESITLEKKSKHEWKIGPTVYYAHWQEFGPKSGKKRWTFTPYLRPGFEQERLPTRTRFAEGLRRIIEGVAR